MKGCIATRQSDGTMTVSLSLILRDFVKQNKISEEVIEKLKSQLGSWINLMVQQWHDDDEVKFPSCFIIDALTNINDDLLEKVAISLSTLIPPECESNRQIICTNINNLSDPRIHIHLKEYNTYAYTLWGKEFIVFIKMKTDKDRKVYVYTCKLM